MKSVGIIALTRIGLDKPEEKYLQVLEEMMCTSSFKGVIGGKPQKALYFLGHHNHDFIYLDPHFVQGAEKDVEEIKSTYFCESFRKCSQMSIDPSIGVCFYFENLESLNLFSNEMNEIKERNKGEFFIFMSEKTPKYARKEGSGSIVEEEYFQPL